jgi:hypothetical protein
VLSGPTETLDSGYDRAAMDDRRASRRLVWLETGVVLVPVLAADTGLVAGVLPGIDLDLGSLGLAIAAGLAVPVGLGALIDYWCEDKSKPPLGPWLAIACAVLLLIQPLCLLTWPTGGGGAIPLLATSLAAEALSFAIALPMCILDATVKRAWLRGTLGALIAVGSGEVARRLFSWIADWKHLTFRG